MGSAHPGRRAVCHAGAHDRLSAAGRCGGGGHLGARGGGGWGTRRAACAPRRTNMSLIIRRRTGFTDTLFKKAEMSPGGKFTTSAFVEGPYGEQSFASYGTVMLFAAGVGITHQVPHVRDLVAGYANGTHATRKVTLVCTSSGSVPG